MPASKVAVNKFVYTLLKLCINYALSENRLLKGMTLRAVPSDPVGHVGIICRAVVKADYFTGSLAAGAGFL